MPQLPPRSPSFYPASSALISRRSGDKTGTRRMQDPIAQPELPRAQYWISPPSEFPEVATFGTRAPEFRTRVPKSKHSITRQKVSLSVLWDSITMLLSVIQGFCFDRPDQCEDSSAARVARSRSVF